MTETSLSWTIASLEATTALAARLALALAGGATVYLRGDLGAGKTTFTAKLAAALGIVDPVKSPTYTIVESYSLPSGQQLHHLDLYRLTDPEELLYLALEDIVQPTDICMIEWPERGAALVLPSDIVIDIRYVDVECDSAGASVNDLANDIANDVENEGHREFVAQAQTERGRQALRICAQYRSEGS